MGILAHLRRSLRFINKASWNIGSQRKSPDFALAGSGLFSNKSRTQNGVKTGFSRLVLVPQRRQRHYRGILPDKELD